MHPLSEDEKCAAALAEFTDLLVAGRAPSIDLFLLGYKDIEERLRPLLETTLTMRDAFDALRRRKGSRSGRRRPK